MFSYGVTSDVCKNKLGTMYVISSCYFSVIKISEYVIIFTF